MNRERVLGLVDRIRTTAPKGYAAYLSAIESLYDSPAPLIQFSFRIWVERRTFGDAQAKALLLLLVAAEAHHLGDEDRASKAIDEAEAMLGPLV